ncbi:murein transglycosylase A [Rubellimicrobium rubrum]|nr:MltA domain-containing protein [Rubellimicrobium rubrum]
MAASAGRRVTGLEFSNLRGWAEDDHASALSVFCESCGDMRGDDWARVCAKARGVRPTEAKAFFEATFRPVLIEDDVPSLFTGYYEPELHGALVRSDRFHVPLYGLPPELPKSEPWLTRGQIEDGALVGQGLEIAWLDDPVEAFFLQVQGSGRIRLPDGRIIRLGYAGSNRHPYSSIGRALIERGAVRPEEASADVVKAWLADHPAEAGQVLRTNASFVFFREISEVPADQGPLGTMNRPVTPLRSVAVDPAAVPLGGPVWIEVQGPEPFCRLMVAQDTGSAITGAQRADIFFGTGPDAGLKAGRVRAGGRIVVLLPAQHAELPRAKAEGPS